MKYEIRIDERAIEEAQIAYEFYENRQSRLGNRFKKELDENINRILSNPKQYRKIKQGYRQVGLQKFPFIIVYSIIENIIIVYSIFHTSRNPKTKI